MTVEQFIKDCTRSCSNVLYYHNRNFTHGTDYVEGSGIEVQYSPWLTPEQALRAVEIAKNAFIEKACMNLKKLMYDSLMFQGRLHREEVIDNFIEDFKKHIEE